VKPSKRTVLALVAVLAALTLVWHHFSSLPKRWTEVRPGWLYRSAQIPGDRVESVLREQRIDVVIDVTDDPTDPDFAPEAAAAHALGVRYLHFPVTAGSAGEVQSYARAVVAIAEAHARGDRVLVHCELGHRRSAGVIALYAQLIEREPPEIANRELYRYADSRAAWQSRYAAFLARNLSELEALVAAELEPSVNPASIPRRPPNQLADPPGSPAERS